MRYYYLKNTIIIVVFLAVIYLNNSIISNNNIAVVVVDALSRSDPNNTYKIQPKESSSFLKSIQQTMGQAISSTQFYVYGRKHFTK